jgi:hypothetical protein
MIFSATDLTAIKNAIEADTTALGEWNAGNTGLLCQYLNSVPSPSQNVTREDVPSGELFHCLVASDLSALTAWELTALQLAAQAGTIDFTKSTVTSGLASIFPSSSPTYANIMGIAVRPATRLEAIFLSGGVSTHYGDQIDLPTLLVAMAS